MKKALNILTVVLLGFWAMGFSTMAKAQSAASEQSTTAPNLGTTKEIARVMKDAEKGVTSSQDAVTRYLADYDLYSPKIENAEYVLDRLEYCKDAKGKTQAYCKYFNTKSGADVLASSFLDTLAYDSKQQEAALEYIKQATNPIPKPFPQGKELENYIDKNGNLTERGISFFADIYKTLPMMSLSQNTFAAAWADRVRLKGFSANLPVGEKGDASMLEMLHYEVERRYMNPGWYDAMNNTTSEGVLREIANMMAFQNYLELKRYEQMARIEVLLAAQTGVFSGLNAELMQMDAAEAEIAEARGDEGTSGADSASGIESVTEGIFN